MTFVTREPAPCPQPVKHSDDKRSDMPDRGNPAREQTQQRDRQDGKSWKNETPQR